MLKIKLIDIILTELKIICKENDIDFSELNCDTLLFGENSIIDSLALVGLIIKVEDYLFEQTGKEIQIIDEQAIITGTETPFKSAVTLAELAISKYNAA